MIYIFVYLVIAFCATIAWWIVMDNEDSEHSRLWALFCGLFWPVVSLICIFLKIGKD